MPSLALGAWDQQHTACTAQPVPAMGRPVWLVFEEGQRNRLGRQHLRGSVLEMKPLRPDFWSLILSAQGSLWRAFVERATSSDMHLKILSLVLVSPPAPQCICSSVERLFNVGFCCWSCNPRDKFVNIVLDLVGLKLNVCLLWMLLKHSFLFDVVHLDFYD